MPRTCTLHVAVIDRASVTGHEVLAVLHKYNARAREPPTDVHGLLVTAILLHKCGHSCHEYLNSFSIAINGLLLLALAVGIYIYNIICNLSTWI